MRKNRELFHCPGAEENPPIPWYYWSNYGGNSGLGKDAPGGKFSADQVGDPAGVFLVADSTCAGGWHSINAGDWAYYDQWVAWRHPQATDNTKPWLDGGFNVLFCDGHVENQRKEGLGYYEVLPSR
ncbi:MAG: hypothetical protein JXA11_01010 [Phycisphaerae bacterium]|nr:hypothetical protein [Phycisphaerae bacterium]